MSIAGLLFKQIIIMFVLMMIGFIFYKKGYISDQGSKDIGKLLLQLVIPLVVVNNFWIEKSAETTQTLLHSLVITAICFMISIAISYLIFHKKDGVSTFSASFSNAGFIGIPLVSATLGSHAVIYISMMIVFVNFLQWTIGVWMLTGDKTNMSAKKILGSPILYAVGFGLLVYGLSIPKPAMVNNILTTITAMNTPLAMIVSGVYLAQSDLVAMFKNRNTYFVCFVRLVVIPLITVVLFKFLPFGSLELKTAILITAACPVGSNVAVFAQAYDKDYHSAVEHVCLSTILCLVTVPLIVLFMSVVIH